MGDLAARGLFLDQTSRIEYFKKTKKYIVEQLVQTIPYTWEHRVWIVSDAKIYGRLYFKTWSTYIWPSLFGGETKDIINDMSWKRWQLSNPCYQNLNQQPKWETLTSQVVAGVQQKVTAYLSIHYHGKYAHICS